MENMLVILRGIYGLIGVNQILLFDLEWCLSVSLLRSNNNMRSNNK